MVLAYLATVCAGAGAGGRGTGAAAVVCVCVIVNFSNKTKSTEKQSSNAAKCHHAFTLLSLFFGIFHNICCIGKWIKEKRKGMKRL